jgi:hypothetical protein
VDDLCIASHGRRRDEVNPGIHDSQPQGERIVLPRIDIENNRRRRRHDLVLSDFCLGIRNSLGCTVENAAIWSDRRRFASLSPFPRSP